MIHILSRLVIFRKIQNMLKLMYHHCNVDVAQPTQMNDLNHRKSKGLMFRIPVQSSYLYAF